MTATNELATRASPPVAVAAGNLMGMPLPDLVQWMTLVYLVLMISHKGWRMYREWTHQGGADDSDE
jgi:hypothetical protein